MTSLLTILLYVWLALTGLMIVVWFIRRRRNRKLAAAAAKKPVPHPALVRIDGADTGDRTTPSTDGPTAWRSPVAEATEGATTAAVSAATTDGSDNGDKDDSRETEDFEKIVVLGNEGGPAFDDGAFDDGTFDYGEFNDGEVEDGASSDANPTDDLSTDTAANADDDPAGDELAMSLSDVTTDPGPPATAEPRTLSDMLDGIHLPYDLTPVTAAVEDPDRHLIFLTTHSNAEEVGTKFADELVRLGFGFEPVGLDQAVATRDSDVVSMVIVPKACEVDGDKGPRYGAAGVGDVALELWIGRSSTPPVVI